MTDVCEVSIMGNNLQKIREDKGITRPQLAELVGTNKGQIWKLEKGERRLTDIWLAKLSKALKVSQGEILGDESQQPTTPVIGHVQAGVFVESFLIPEEDQEQLPTPPNPWGYSKFIGLKVKGDSMNEVFPEGTYLYCIEPSDWVAKFNRPLDTGLFVIVQKRGEGNTYESTVKELYRDEETGAVALLPRSNNPLYQAILIDQQDELSTEHHADASAPDQYISAVVIYDLQSRVPQIG